MEPTHILVIHTPHFRKLPHSIRFERSVSTTEGFRIDCRELGIWAEVQDSREVVCFIDQWLVADHARREGKELLLEKDRGENVRV